MQRSSKTIQIFFPSSFQQQHVPNQARGGCLNAALQVSCDDHATFTSHTTATAREQVENNNLAPVICTTNLSLSTCNPCIATAGSSYYCVGEADGDVRYVFCELENCHNCHTTSSHGSLAKCQTSNRRYARRPL